MPCGGFGPSPFDILQQIRSGNLAGALQNVGVIPTDGVNCTSGPCEVNPIMDVGPSLNPQAVLDCYHAYNKSESWPVRFFSFLSFTSPNEEWKAEWEHFSVYLPFKVAGFSLLKRSSQGAGEIAEAAGISATVGATTIDGLGLTSCLPAGVTIPVGPPNVSAGHGPF